ncbi:MULTISPECIES: thioredoxin family protein [Cellulophaga]|uniref:Protein disulfide isomerase n=2 Tax=Cellulophaga TaxID=104264 RepID=F0RAH2_CELLC|nr:MULTISPECIES: thioredoxin family protein [Cellulophaga]ADY30535.1 protein disulfide isomerase [Cellulophaga lytica DSM 7489]AIM61524.1 protein-disulfide isomerase [Cellulophaga lytica]APU11417.1 protein-disulfide isomerase [Cellulophaga lytica]EWH13944.1 protein disulfide isomerase [Cellulophaga geojensis KL-A]MDO6853214.1 thioredoxin family protein [Cellulophaga lytica]
MKHLLIALIFPLVFGFAPANKVIGDVEWNTDYETVLKKAKKADKNILVYFTGSDWCGPCKMLKKDLFATAEFKEISENYELLYIDIPRNNDLLTEKQLKHNMDLMAKYNKKGVFPNLKILDSKGREKGALHGYSMNGEVQHHIKFLKKYMK